MRITDFDVYRDLLKEKAGLALSQEKSYLLESRLSPVAAKWDFINLSAMTAHLRIVPEPQLLDDIVEAMMTNDTSFFRDVEPFNIFRDKVLPYLLKNRIHERKFRIWSVASASGQEPYSLALMLKDHETQFARWKIEMLGTDLSVHAIEAAKNGMYSQFEVQRGLPIQKLLKHFTQTDEGWQISDKIKKMVQFKQFNLLDDMENFGLFDVVFCRNVLLNFDKQTKIDVLERIGDQMKDDAFLFLGRDETTIDICDLFEPVPDMPGVYAKQGSGHLDAENQASA